MSRYGRLGAMLSLVILIVAGCSSAATTPMTSSSSPANGGAVVGVAIPSSVAVVTANNAN